jgi:hypothetical protein
MLLTFWNWQNQKRKAHAEAKDKSSFNAFMKRKIIMAR